MKGRKIRRKIHVAGLKFLVALNLISFIFLASAIDSFITWHPYAVMLVNMGFLYLMAYANGYVCGTKPYYERIERCVKMMRTDYPIADFERYEQEKQEWLDKLPRCSECDEPIQDSQCYEINDEYICDDCMHRNHRKWVDDIVC